MKKNLIPMVCAVAMAGFAACNNSDTSTTTTDSTTTGATTSAATTDATTTSGAEGSMATTEGTSSNPGFSKTSYVDLKTGKTVKIRRDTATGYATNEESSQPIWYYYDPVSSDTFDRSGRLINGAIMKGTSGDWTVDESRIKVKTQGDGDIKTKDDATEVKTKTDADGNNTKIKTENSKEKISNDKYKSKTPDAEIKVKDDKVKVKSKGQ